MSYICCRNDDIIVIGCSYLRSKDNVDINGVVWCCGLTGVASGSPEFCSMPHGFGSDWEITKTKIDKVEPSDTLGAIHSNELATKLIVNDFWHQTSQQASRMPSNHWLQAKTVAVWRG
jgi:hypothetical protein